MVFPASPNFLSSIRVRTPSKASSRVSQIRTPLPRASPSAFSTIGILAVLRYSRASSALSNVAYSAVGMSYFFIRSLEKALLPSKMAAFLRGPKTLRPAFSKTSTTPPTRGSSIPTMVKSISFSLANATSLSNSIAPMGTHSAICAIPAFPGAQ